MLTQLKIFKLESEKEELNIRLRASTEGDQEEKNAMRKLAEISLEIETVKKRGCQSLFDMI